MHARLLYEQITNLLSPSKKPTRITTADSGRKVMLKDSMEEDSIRQNLKQLQVCLRSTSFWGLSSFVLLVVTFGVL